MSITDEIIVMKDGVVQQVGEPQDTYVNPANSFVASFLGNPPINMFDAQVEDGFIIVNGEKAIETKLPNGPIMLGLRPESFKILGGVYNTDKNVFDIDITFKATIGRDYLVRFDLNGKLSKALIESDNQVNVGDRVRVHVKKSGIHVFDTEGNRIQEW